MTQELKSKILDKVAKELLSLKTIRTQETKATY